MKKFICAIMAFIISIMWCVPAFASDNSVIVSKNNISHKVSDNLYGISLGDSSFAIDGGMNANLVNNNSFEYKDNPEYAWDFSDIKAVVSTNSPICKTNETYESLTIESKSTIYNIGYPTFFSNEEYDQSKAEKADMHFEKGVTYEFSCFLRNIDFDGSVSVFLNSSSNKNKDINVNISNVSNSSWKRVSAKIKSRSTENGSLGINFRGEGTICIDYVSLVATNSYGYGDANWKNGVFKAEYVEAIKNLKPSFIRFATNGQTTSDGNSNYFVWKDTIDSLEKRVQYTNVNNDFKTGYCYNNSNTIGLQEYLQLCSDINAKPIMVVGAGIKNQSKEDYEAHLQALNKTYMDDEQWREYLKYEIGIKKSEIGAYTEYIDSLKIKTKKDFNKYVNSISLKPGTSKFSNYVQDILDMIEFANGDSEGTYWGSIRAKNGSEQSYNVEYIQIGDENWGDVYWRNFEAIKKAINKEYPNIKIIASTGYSPQGEVFENSKKQISSHPDVLADEHYISDKETILSDNVNRYDSYDRASNNVIIGSLFSNDASFGKGISRNNLYSATEEAAFITGLEKNSDVVKMMSMSSTFAKIDSAKNNQSLVWFDSENLVLTPDYYTQMIFANNTGKNYVKTNLSKENDEIFVSTTIDENTSSVFVKLVNISGGKEKISVSLDGFGDISAASYQQLGGKYKSASNNENKQTVAPVSDELDYNKNSTEVTLKPYSVTVVRIAYGENTGKGFFTISDNINTEVRAYLPMSAKIFILMMILIFVLATIVTYLVYSKVVLKGKKFKFQKKNSKKANNDDLDIILDEIREEKED